jgi:tetratricopeptide (TPR) repeat protein
VGHALNEALIDFYIRNKKADGLRALDTALAKAPINAVPAATRPYLGLVEGFSVLGRPDRAQALLGQYREAVDTAQRRIEESAFHYAQGEVLLAERRYPEALAEYRRADVAPDGPAHACLLCLPARVARAFDAAGQADSAIASFEEVLVVPQANRQSLDVFILPYSHERLAALYEARGEPAKAALHYRALIDLWKNADPELQPQVEAARAAVHRLADVEGRPRP